MNFRLQISSIIILAVFVVALQPAPSASYANPELQLDRRSFANPKESSTTQVLQSDDRGITFELITSPFTISDNGEIEIGGLDEISSDPGSPALPYFSTFIALPPSAEVLIQVQELELTKQGPLNILPVPQAKLSGEAADENEILAYGAGSGSGVRSGANSGGRGRTSACGRCRDHSSSLAMSRTRKPRGRR